MNAKPKHPISAIATLPAIAASRRTRAGRAARVAVSLVLNFEEGAEFTVSEGDAVNESIYEVDHRLSGPDPCIESHFEYGTRSGWWRIMDVLDAHDVKLTVSSCGRAVERSPALARDAVARGHEVAAHGWRWESHAGMDEASERQTIARTVAAIEQRNRQTPGRLAHPVGVFAQHAAAVGRGRRLSLRQRRLQ